MAKEGKVAAVLALELAREKLHRLQDHVRRKDASEWKILASLDNDNLKALEDSHWEVAVLALDLADSCILDALSRVPD